MKNQKKESKQFGTRDILEHELKNAEAKILEAEGDIQDAQERQNGWMKERLNLLKALEKLSVSQEPMEKCAVCETEFKLGEPHQHICRVEAKESVKERES